jgi:hypothetical protein
MDGRFVIDMLDFARWTSGQRVLLPYDRLFACLFVQVGMCFIPFSLCSCVHILALALVHMA